MKNKKYDHHEFVFNYLVKPLNNAYQYDCLRYIWKKVEKLMKEYVNFQGHDDNLIKEINSIGEEIKLR